MNGQKQICFGWYQNLELLFKNQNKQYKDKQQNVNHFRTKKVSLFILFNIFKSNWTLYQSCKKLIKVFFQSFCNLKTRNFANNADVTGNKHKHYIYIVSK